MLLVVFPLFPSLATLSWFCTWVYLLVIYSIHPVEKTIISREASSDLPFISYVAAHHLAVFITGTVLTSLFFITTLVLFYRTHKRLSDALNEPWRSRWDAIAVAFGVISSISLVLLAIVHIGPDVSKTVVLVHWILTLVFISCAVLSAIFNVIAIHQNRRHIVTLNVSIAIKIIFIIVTTGLLIAFILFATCTIGKSDCIASRTKAAYMEWTLAVLYNAYLVSWIIDFVLYHRGWMRLFFH